MLWVIIAIIVLFILAVHQQRILRLMNQDALIAASPLAWLTFNPTITENQKVLEFTNHRFLIDLYADMHDDIVVIKSAQVGESVERIFKALWCAQYMKANIIYVLPTKNIIDDFVVPKVNPIIAANPHVKALIKSDSRSLKQVGDRFIYFSGAFSETAAIMKSADILIMDELDRMKQMSIVNMFDSRLQASEMGVRKQGIRWRLSNPSQLNFGVHALWLDSDMRYWFVDCSHCGHKAWMDFTKEEMYTNKEGEPRYSHYVDRNKEIYACGNCDKEIYDQDRRMGRWIARFPDRHRHGYWISQMMAPWVSAKRILEQEAESNIEFFYNFVLGKAYTPTDMIVDRAAIIRATAPSTIMRSQVVIGVDQDAGGQYYVCMTPQGIFDHGYVDAWEKIEHLKLMYNAIVVCDPNPYQAMPKQMAAKYSDWYLCYFKNLDGMSAVQWKDKEQIVYADRTRVIDIRANEIVHARLLYRERVHELEDVIAHWNNLYRTTEEKEDGRIKSTWIKKEDRQSDYPFAEVYARIGLNLVLGGDSTFLDPSQAPESKVTNITTNDGSKLTVDFSDIISETYSEFDQ